MLKNRSQIASRVLTCIGLLASALFLLVATERPAKAYVDPGSGALVWQGLLAAVVGVLFYFRRVIGWVKARLFKEREN